MKTLFVLLSLLALQPNAWGAVTDRDRLELGLSKNYIQNGGAESGAAGWTTYADGASATPVDGIGGSPNSTWTSSTSSPLSGSASFLFTKNSGASRQGEGVCYPFTLDAADKAKPLTVSYDFTTVSGTYVTGDLTTYLFDVTNSTVIQPAPYQIPNVTAGVSQKWISYFQTSATGTSYRLCFHVAVSTNSANVLKFDNIRVSSTYQSYGAVATDWQSFTGAWTGSSSNPALGTNTSEGSYRRVGDSLELYYTLVQTGAGSAGSGQYRLTLPGGLVADTTKMTATSNAASERIVGSASIYDGTNSYTGYAYLGTSTGIEIATPNASGSTNSVIFGSATISFGSASLRVTLRALIPITGWSSNVQVSSDAETRVVSFQGAKSGTQAVTANVTDITVVSTKDSHGAWSGSAYTAPVPGDYLVVASLANNAAGTYNVNAYKNGTLFGPMGSADATAVRTSATLVPNVKAGDTLSVRSDTTVTVFATGQISIFRLSGPAQIAASEKVRLKYQNTAGTSITSTITTVPYATKIYDSHSAFNGATGVFTAPRSDYYRLYVRGRLQSVNNSTSQVVEMEAIVTSTPESLSAGVQQLDARFGNGAAHVQNFGGGGTWWLNQGDTIAVQVANTNTIGLDTTVGYNVIQIESQGGI